MLRCAALLLLFQTNLFANQFIDFRIDDSRTVKLPLGNLSSEQKLRWNGLSDTKGQRKKETESKRLVSLKSKMTRVQDQKDRGTCAAFAFLGLLEFFEKKDLSEQCLSKFAWEVDPTTVEHLWRWSWKNGLYLEKDCPYVGAENGRNDIPDLSHAESIRFDGSDYDLKSLDANSLTYIKKQIDLGFPVAISIFSAGDWNRDGIIELPSKAEIRRDCRGKVDVKTPVIDKCGIHFVVVTGYDDDKEYLEFKNSWGKNWPKSASRPDGYGKMSYEYFLTMKVDYHRMVSRWQ